MAANDTHDHDASVQWRPNTWRKWPGDLRWRRDPGDRASLDCGTRSPTTLKITRDGAEFVCAHARTRFTLQGTTAPVTDRDLTRLVLYLAYLGGGCDCFRARWRYLRDGEKFCRRAAIDTWRWIEDMIGYQAIHLTWERRDPPGKSWRGWGEAVYDGLCPGIPPQGCRLP